MITIYIKVKFRVAGWTIGTVERTVNWNVNFPVPSFDQVLLDDRGVLLRVSA